MPAEALPEKVVRTRELGALTRRDPKGAASTLAAVLGRRTEDRDLRVAAATLLRQVDPGDAEPILMRNLRTDDSEVRYRVIKSLGRIGGLAALRSLDRLGEPASEAEAKQLAFSKALIAYREGIDRDDIPFVKGVRRRPGPEERLLELRLKRLVSPRRVGEVVSALGRDTFGIQPATDLAFEVDVGRSHWTLLLNREAAEQGLLEPMRLRRWLLGLLALRAPATKSHAVQYVVLTKPVGDATEILVVRSSGEVVYSGRAEPSLEELGFQIADVRRPGTAPTRVEGRLTSAGFELSVALPFRSRVGQRKAETQSPQALRELRRRLEAGSQ